MGDWNRDYRSASMVGRNPEIVRDAANAEIDRLRADNERLREALLGLIDAYEWWCEDQYDRDQRVVGDAIYEARAALESK